MKENWIDRYKRYKLQRQQQRSLKLKNKLTRKKPLRKQNIYKVSNKDNTRNKAAVLIGLNYTGTRAALKGCINDAKRMRETLRTKYGYKNISVLTDKDITPQRNILQILEELISGNNKRIYFQYSGHGVQTRDKNNDESDGMDEALYSVGGTIITDDEINERIKKVKPGVTMVLVIDACHSGTVIDLPYQLDNTDQIVKVNQNRIEGDVICITGCRDNQVSMDVHRGTTAYGAMSNALQTVIKRINGTVSWRMLIHQLRSELRKNKYAQVPQLCVSRPELINTLVEL